MKDNSLTINTDGIAELDEQVETRRPEFDYQLMAIVMALIALGLVMIYSASAVTASSRFGDPAYYLKKQIFNVGVGIIFIIVGMRIPYMKYKKYVYVLLLGSLGLLALLLIISTLEG